MTATYHTTEVSLSPDVSTVYAKCSCGRVVHFHELPSVTLLPNGKINLRGKGRVIVEVPEHMYD